MDGRWFALAGCLAVAGCDAGAEDEAPEKGSSSGASTGGCASGGCDESTTDVPEPDATTGAAQSSSSGTDAGSTSSVGASTSTGDAETGEETGGEDACGPAPAGPIEGCTPWRVELPSGFQTNAIIPFPGDLYVVSGTLDGVGYVEAFDTQGASQWSFEHATNVIEAVPVGDDRLFGVVSGTPGFVFLLEIETQTVLWEQRLDEDFVVFPDLGPNTYFIAQQPKHVAASADGQLAVVMRGTGWNDYHVTMGLDPLTGEQTWLHVDYADWYFSTELRFNDVGGWFVHLAAYGVGGGAGFRTRRFDPETGAELE
ncbi:MAG: PQQ-binding-like beta-propeller repeat protein, partial [Myxococcota bacterium]